MDSSERQSFVNRFTKSDALVLAASTFIGYLVVFAYEAGFCSYYHIPYSLISLNLPTGLAAAGTLFSTFFLLSYYARARFAAVLASEKSQLLMARYIALLFIFELTSIVSGVNSFAAIMTYLTIFIIVPRMHAKYEAWCKKLLGADSADPLLMPLLKNVPMPERLLVPIHYLALASVALLLASVFLFGRYRGPGDVRYLTDRNKENLLLLRIYGDYMIMAPCYIDMKHDEWVLMGRESSGPVIVVKRELRIYKLGDRDTPPRLFAYRRGIPIETEYQGSGGFMHWLFPYDED